MRVLLLGAGKIGCTIIDLLRLTGDYKVTVGEREDSVLAALADKGVPCLHVNVTDGEALSRALHNQDIVINALPHQAVAPVAVAAVKHGVHYFDLTEDVATTRLVKDMAATAKTALMPQCGLAPGFISIATHNLISHFDTVRDVQMRVGALPVYPTNALKYNLTWSTDGLINEYCMPCECIMNGLPDEVLPLEGYETISIDGVEYECFNTSGGIGTMCETLAGKIENLNYKTLRYIGHCEIMRLLVNELGLGKRRDLLKDVLETAIPSTLQDEVLIFISAKGKKNNRLLQENFVRKIYGTEIAGIPRSAIQVTTAAGICGVLDLFASGRLPKSGFIRQEQVNLQDFLGNRFGQFYTAPGQGGKHS